jgi:chitinase
MLLAPPTPFDVVGYLPNYRLEAFETMELKGLTDVVIFSAEVSPNGEIRWAHLTESQLSDAARRCREEGIRPHLSIGGWERSEGFAEMSADAAARRAFVRACAALADRHQLAGIDLDWEHPKNSAEEEAYADLLTSLKAALGPQRMVTIAKAGWQKLPARAWKSVDRVHLMAYDHDGPHSTFEQAVQDVLSVKALGAPAQKVALGLPFYARHEQNRDALTYGQVRQRFKPNRDQDRADGYFWNSPALIAQKTAWARAQGLGGVMIWEIGQDDPGPDSLLGAIRRALAG